MFAQKYEETSSKQIDSRCEKYYFVPCEVALASLVLIPAIVKKQVLSTKLLYLNLIGKRNLNDCKLETTVLLPSQNLLPYYTNTDSNYEL